VHFQRASQYPQVINTNKGQTQVQPEYYTPYNNIGHPVNPIRTTIVPTEGEYRHRQAQNKGLPPLGTTYQHQRTGNQNCKNRSGEYRTLIKFTSCLTMVGDSLRVLRLLPPLTLVAMI
jgi:hypothetical protein